KRSALKPGVQKTLPPGFNALRFFQWLSEARPSWYTAVPTMHQAILPRAARNPEQLAEAKLRFIRSSSASLPAQ
ncbi:MAG: AMP-dependent synthetase, partial [Mesorhizobium sp.]